MVLFVWALHRLRNQDAAGALRIIAKAESLGALSPVQMTFKGLVLLIAHRFEEAETIWRAVVAKFSHNISPNVRYAFLFSRARLHALDGNDAMCAHDERTASMIRCSRLVKQRLLPGPALIEANDR